MLVSAATIGYDANAMTGDVNGDGFVTSADVTAIYDVLLGTNDTFQATADVNGDGYVTSADVTAVYDILLNGEEPSPGIPDFNINVEYDTSNDAATVTVAKNIRDKITVSVNGGHVNIVADPSLQDSVIYNLTGTTDNGSFYMDGDYKCIVNITDLFITNPDSAAINIDNGKRIDINLSGNSHLVDGTGGPQKACLFVNGHAVIDGSGILNITGKGKHGYFSDEYTVIKNGQINVQNAQGDALHINQYFQMDGGTLNLTTVVGDGIDVGCTKDPSDTNNGQIIINDGTINVSVFGDAVKGIKCESIMTVNGGWITSSTSGNAIYDTAKADISSCAAIKCDSTFNMTAGTVSLVSTGTGGKGLNCDGSINISGGTFYAVTTGDVYEYSSTLDTKAGGMKADGSITLSGGTVLVAASSDDAKAFNGKCGFFTNGGYILGIGGKSSTVSSGYTQKYKYYRNQVITGGSTVTYDGVSMNIPSYYSNSSAMVTVSSPEIQ